MNDKENDLVQFYFSILMKEKHKSHAVKETLELINHNEIIDDNMKIIVDANGLINEYNFSQELLKIPQQESSTSEDLKSDIKSKSKSRLSYNSNYKTQKSFICAFENCGKRFDYKWILDRHINSHFCFKLHKCEYAGCEKAYKSRENLNLHIRNKHLGEKPYQCRYCISRFSHRNGRTNFNIINIIRQNIPRKEGPHEFSST